MSDFDDESQYEEEYHCSICGKIFYMRYQDEGGIDFDPGSGRCDACGKVFCSDCAKWHKYEDRQGACTLCENCSNEKLLKEFNIWYEQFNREYCSPKDGDCDNCPFFFKDGCMAKLLNELVDFSLHTEGVKAMELDRIQKRNRQKEHEWEIHLREMGVLPKKRK